MQDFKGKNAGYVNKFNALVREHNGPLITLEKFNRHDDTARRYEQLGRKKDAYFVKTRYQSSQPQEISWDEVCDFISLFSSLII